MIKYWRINEAGKYLILREDSIWISRINENETSIEEAIKEQKLFGKTKTHRFAEMESIIFDEDNFRIYLKHLPDENNKKKSTVEIEVQKADYNDLKKHLLQVFNKATFKDLNFFEREKLSILSLASSVFFGLMLFTLVGFSYSLVGFVIALTVLEIGIIKIFFKMPENGKILKLN